MKFFKWPIWRSLFSSVGKNSGCLLTGLFKIHHDTTVRFYSQCLAWGTDESCGHEAKDGDNIFHNPLQPIFWVILMICINIHPKEQLRLPIIQPLWCDVENFPYATLQGPLISKFCNCSTRLSGHNAMAMANHWPGTLSGKSCLPNLGPPALSIVMALYLNMCGSSESNFFQKLHPRHPQYKLSVGKK